MTVLFLGLALATPPPQPPVDPSGQQQLERIAGGVLTGWASANIAAGVPLAIAAQDERPRWFWGGNAGWNTVNLGLGLATLVRQGRTDWGQLSAAELDKRQRGLETAFWVNGGLDVGYVTAGLLMRGHDDPRVAGAGDALIVQGAFLFAFDLTMAAIQRHVRKKRAD